ncbi:unnamed protein product, partial [Vitis vinifera]|uniref:Uncharacterized protein n=1 Tax=Vitis vinifera TaxID=29760 RepID=D7SL28_VITVI
MIRFLRGLEYFIKSIKIKINSYMPIILKRSKTLIQNIFANHLNFNILKNI